MKETHSRNAGVNEQLGRRDGAGLVARTLEKSVQLCGVAGHTEMGSSQLPGTLKSPRENVDTVGGTPHPAPKVAAPPPVPAPPPLEKEDEEEEKESDRKSEVSQQQKSFPEGRAPHPQPPDQ